MQSVPGDELSHAAHLTAADLIEELCLQRSIERPSPLQAHDRAPRRQSVGVAQSTLSWVSAAPACHHKQEALLPWHA